MSCYVMFCYAMLCYVMLCFVLFCYVMLCYKIGSRIKTMEVTFIQNFWEYSPASPSWVAHLSFTGFIHFVSHKNNQRFFHSPIPFSLS